MRDKPDLPNEKLQGWLEEAEIFFEDGKENRAVTLLHNNIKHYANDSVISAYLYVRFEEIWKWYRSKYDFNYEILRMSDDEFEERLKAAMKENRFVNREGKKFKQECQKAFARYLKKQISVEKLAEKLKETEKTVLDQVLTPESNSEFYSIFNAYFFMRNNVSGAFVEKHQSFIIDNYRVRLAHEQVFSIVINV